MNFGDIEMLSYVVALVREVLSMFYLFQISWLNWFIALFIILLGVEIYQAIVVVVSRGHAVFDDTPVYMGAEDLDPDLDHTIYGDE